jgi:hypothetical protein
LPTSRSTTCYPVAPAGSLVKVALALDECYLDRVHWPTWNASETDIGSLFVREATVLQAIVDRPHLHLVERVH